MMMIIIMMVKESSPTLFPTWLPGSYGLRLNTGVRGWKLGDNSHLLQIWRSINRQNLLERLLYASMVYGLNLAYKHLKHYLYWFHTVVEIVYDMISLTVILLTESCYTAVSILICFQMPVFNSTTFIRCPWNFWKERTLSWRLKPSSMLRRVGVNSYICFEWA
jgi:hypothetical protein